MVRGHRSTRLRISKIPRPNKPRPLRLPGSFRLALTGTPVENRLTELWSIMQFLNPGYLTSLEKFRCDQAVPIERFGETEATQPLKHLVGAIRPAPCEDRSEHDPGLAREDRDQGICNLVEEQATLYEAVVKT